MGGENYHETTPNILSQIQLRCDLAKEIIIEQGKLFPYDPIDQLIGAIGAVFDSWGNPRARLYREMHDIPDDIGTAVTIQAMVFGNLNSDSGSGVYFTRNPLTGSFTSTGEWLRCAQGEDVVSGRRTPHDIRVGPKSLKETFPQIFEKLYLIGCMVEGYYYLTPQDIEFTIEDGHLWILQTRELKISRPRPKEIVQKQEILGKGLPVCRGIATGRLLFDQVLHRYSSQIY